MQTASPIHRIIHCHYAGADLAFFESFGVHMIEILKLKMNMKICDVYAYANGVAYHGDAW